LFQYLDGEGNRHAIDSGMVNDYLCDTMRSEFTAKDFRTWHATVHAIELLKALPVPQPLRRADARRACARVLSSVAKELRNTPAVCRKSYINPQLFLAWEKGMLRRHFQALPHLRGSRGERALVRFLSAY
jgi:DNA topoisomerase I